MYIAASRIFYEGTDHKDPEDQDSEIRKYILTICIFFSPLIKKKKGEQNICFQFCFQVPTCNCSSRFSIVCCMFSSVPSSFSKSSCIALGSPPSICNCLAWKICCCTPCLFARSLLVLCQKDSYSKSYQTFNLVWETWRNCILQFAMGYTMQTMNWNKLWKYYLSLIYS